MQDASSASPNDSTISYGGVFRYFMRGRKEFVICLVLFLLVATVAAILSEKEYLVEGTIKQTDLTDVLRPSQGMSGALGLLSAASNTNDRINSYISVITSPEVAEKLLSNSSYIDILFGGKWVRQGNSTEWKHRKGIGWTLKQNFCSAFQIECPDHLTALQVSQELGQHIALEPSSTITQGVLTSIGNTDTFDISLRGKNPRALLKMLEFLHDTANTRIQHSQIALATQVSENLDQRVGLIQNEEVRSQVISLLSTQEQKLAVLHAGGISYAAAWLVSPTVSAWPVRPNIPLFYILAFVGALATALIIVVLREHLSKPRALPTQ